MPDDIEALIEKASQKFQVNGTALFTLQGGQIDDIDAIRDDETLLLTVDGETFHISTCQSVVVKQQPHHHNHQFAIMPIGERRRERA